MKKTFGLLLIFLRLSFGYAQSPIVSTADWKLRASIVADADTAIVRALSTGSDYASYVYIDAGATRSISVKLPALTLGGMFIYSFEVDIAGVQVNSYQSSDGVTWQPLQTNAYTNGRPDDLQKIDIPQSASQKWFRVSFTNSSSTLRKLREIGMYQFKENVKHQYFLVMGASLTETAKGHTEWLQTVREKVGPTLQPVIFNWAASSETSEGIRNRVDGYLAQHPYASFVLLEAGGNDVSADRPLTFDTNKEKYIAITRKNIKETAQAIKNAGKGVALSRLSYRNYPANTSWRGWAQASVENGLHQEHGSLPYNFMMDSLIKEWSPQFWNSEERRGFIDFYPYTLNNQQWLGDGVHFRDSEYGRVREFWANNVFKYLYTGQRAPLLVYNEIVPNLTALATAAVVKAELTQLERDKWDAKLLVDQIGNRQTRLSLMDRLEKHGLTGRYHSNANAGFAAPVTLTRTDSLINFDWGYLAPDPSVSINQFSVRWTGRIKPPSSQEYTFYTRSDDGIRLFINGTTVIDKWLYQGETEYSGKITLNADQFYDIQLDYFDGNGGATCKLSWSTPTLPKQIVPSIVLYPETEPVVPTVPVITLHPVNTTVTAGTNAVFSVTAVSTLPIRYQWQRNGSNIAGATTSTYTEVAPTLASNNTTYLCIVSNDVGPILSSQATLTVNPPAVAPSFTLQPLNATVLAGGSVSFSVSVTGTAPFTYQWQKNGTPIVGQNASTLTLLNVALADNTTQYRCVVTNSVSSITSSFGTLTVNPTPVSNGLTGRYYSNVYASFNNTLSLTRIDPTINFNWLAGSPDPLVTADKFAVRWTGKIQPSYSQTYTFYTQSDDGVRLWVDGTTVPLIDKWLYQGEMEYFGSITLTAGVKYNIKLEYFDGNGGAVCRLLWASPSTPKQIVPTTALFPESSQRTGEEETTFETEDSQYGQELLIYPTILDDELSIVNVKEGNTILVYAMNGQLVDERSVASAGKCVVSLGHIPSGPYFLKVGSQTRFFVKR